MMSKSSFCKLVLDEARRNLWALALSALGFLFAGPLSIVIYWQEHQSAIGFDEASAAAAEADLIEGLSEWLVVPLSRGGLMIMALLCGIVMFRFLHDRRQVDFYHALPIRREGLYAVKFSAGLLLVLPAYFVSRLLSVAVIAALGYFGAIAWGMLLTGIFADLCTFFAMYGITVLCAVLCGNTLVSVMLSLWALISPYAAVMTLETFAQSFYPTYSYVHEWNVLYCSIAAFLEFSTESTRTEAIFFAVHTLLGVAALVLSFLLFRRRRAERSGQAIAFYPLRLPLKIYSCLVMGLFVGCILSAIVGNGVGIFWLYLFTAVSTAVCHCVMEAVYAGDARAFFQKRGMLLILTAASLLVCFGLQSDVFGYSRWVPQERSVKWAVLENLSAEDTAGECSVQTERAYYSYYDESHRLHDSEVIQAMCRLAELGVEHRDLQSWGAQSWKEREELAERLREAGPCYTLRLSFGMSADRRKGREYTLPVTEESTALVNTVLYSEDYLRSNSAVFLYEGWLENNASSGWKPTITAVDLLDRDTQTLRDHTRIMELLEALKADVLEAVPEQAAVEGPVLRLYFGRYREAPYNDNRSGDMMMIYPSYHRTLALIQEYMGVVPQPLRAEDFASVTIELHGESSGRIGSTEMTSDVGVGYREVTTTDPEQIAGLIKDLVCSDTRDGYHHFGMWIKDDISVRLLCKNGSNSYDFAYPADRVPEELIEALFSGDGQ